MCELEAIEAKIRNSPDVRDRVGRACVNYSTSLLAVFRPASGKPLQLGGTGTLVTAQDSYYVLTAAHVWEKVLSHADAVGLTLREHHDHEFLIPIESIVVSYLRRPQTWGESGPDIAALRIPPEQVGTIKSFRVFYRVPDMRIFDHVGNHLETSILIGTPHELSDFDPNHADLAVHGFFLNEPMHQSTCDRFDYFNVEANTNLPGVPQSFGGVSGGGLWKVLIYCSGPDHRVETAEILHGVAYYQFPPANGRSTIRCHGPLSIQTVATNLAQCS